MDQLLVKFKAYGKRNGIPVDNRFVTGDFEEEAIVSRQRLYSSGMHYNDVCCQIMRQRYPEVDWTSATMISANPV